MKKNIIKKMPLTVIAMVLAGCASSKEFETTPQKGANRTGVFPSFTQQPKAETAQFTQVEHDELTQKLIKNRNKVRQDALQIDSSLKNTEQEKEEAIRAAQETLRAIEQTDQ